MPTTDPDLTEALKRFRLDILKAFASLDADVQAIAKTVVQSDIKTATRLETNRREAKQAIQLGIDRFAQEISLAHKTR